jgi:hypothetical protein
VRAPHGDSEPRDETPTQEVSQATRSLSPEELAYLAGTDGEDGEEQAEPEPN